MMAYISGEMGQGNAVFFTLIRKAGKTLMNCLLLEFSTHVFELWVTGKQTTESETREKGEPLCHGSDQWFHSSEEEFVASVSVYGARTAYFRSTCEVDESCFPKLPCVFFNIKKSPPQRVTPSFAGE